jgi:hypothetical protein
MTRKNVPGLNLMNRNGGIYHPGRTYNLEKKIDVGFKYMQAVEDAFPALPSKIAVAKSAGVSTCFVRKVAAELASTGQLADPDIAVAETDKRVGTGDFLTKEEVVFLLSLRAESPSRPNKDYAARLYETYGRHVSPQFISDWFKKGFPYKGSFRKPNLIPLDKFRPENIVRYLEYRAKIEQLFDHSKYHFCDEKHLVNKDVYSKRARADPLTGYMDCVYVSGDFRATYNLLAITSANPRKAQNMAYSLGVENGDSAAFLLFIEGLIVSKWFEVGDILIMDNAAIHTGGEAAIVENLLWECQVNGTPLRVLIVYLPTRSPELNPIELLFHVLARRIQSWQHRLAEQGPNAVVEQASRVLDEMSYELILSCYVHCGY